MALTSKQVAEFRKKYGIGQAAGPGTSARGTVTPLSVLKGETEKRQQQAPQKPAYSVLGDIFGSGAKPEAPGFVSGLIQDTIGSRGASGLAAAPVRSAADAFVGKVAGSTSQSSMQLSKVNDALIAKAGTMKDGDPRKAQLLQVIAENTRALGGAAQNTADTLKAASVNSADDSSANRAKKVLGQSLNTFATAYTGGAAPGILRTTIGGKVTQGLIQGAKVGAAGGALSGAAKGANEDESLPGIVLEGAKGALGGALTGAAIGGIAPVGTAAGANASGKAMNLLGRIVKGAGQKIQVSVIRPTARDVADGFDIANLAKYDIGGSLGQSFVKVNQKMNELSERLSSLIGESDGKLDLREIVAKTALRLTKDKAGQFGQNSRIARVLKQLQGEVDTVAPGGLADLATGQTVKRAAGTRGAWSYGMPDRDAVAEETVYTTFYHELKTAIEGAVGDKAELKAINKALSELIPINNAIVRRMPVAERNNAISLTDTVGLFSAVFDPRALVLVGLNRASKSGRVGSALSKVGAAISSKAPNIKLDFKP